MKHRLAAFVLPLLVIGACKAATSSRGSTGGDGTPLPEGGTFYKADLLEAFGQCAASRTRAFVGLATDLEAATAKAESDPTEANRLAAQEAWRRAIDTWQQLEVFQFGPAAVKASPGGRDLRESIYSWPLGSRCLTEQVIVNQGYLSPDFATGLVNTRGLLTAEYLLFYGGTDNACGPSSAMNTNGTWAAIGATELAARKASYAHAVAADVLKRANELADAWDPAKENFVAQLRTAGHGSAVYTSEQMAFNAVSDALFYLEFDVKDAKLGRPAGLQDCTKATCPEALESQFAMRSKEHVRNNLLGFRLLFEGCGPNGEGLGFDDYLYAVGAADLADEMKRELAASLAALDAIEEPDLSEALTTDLESVKALYAAVKKVTDRLKVDFVAVLDLDLPARFEGDND